MMKTVNYIVLNLARRNYNVPLIFHKGDANANELRLSLQSNGQTVTLTSAMSATADAVVNSVIVAQGESLTVDTENNVVVLELTENMLSLAGTLKIDVRITESDELLTAATLIFQVEDSVINGDSRFEPVSPAIAEAIAQVAENTEDIAELQTELQELEAGLPNPFELEYTADKVDQIHSGDQAPIDLVKYPSVNAVKGYVDGEFRKLDAVAESPNLFILESQTLDGITVTDNGDGTYTFNGTNTATTLFQAFLLPAGRYTASAEILSGTATNQFAVKYGSNNETWISTNIASATVLFTTATAVYFRLNLGTFTNFRLEISIEKENVYTAIDTVARAANSAAQAQLGSLSAQAGPLYPLAEPDGFTWKNSPLHGKILTDFRGVYQVDFDVADYKNNPGKVLYVSPDGSDSNAGTPDAPLAKMSTAYTNGASTIYLYPGIYNLSTSIFGTTINRDLNIIGLGEGIIISTRIINIPNTSPNVTEYSTGVWRCYSNGTTYLSNVVDIAHKTADGHYTKYSQLPSKMEVLMTSGSWALVTETIDGNDKTVAYIHTLSGENPLAGDDVLLLYSPMPSDSPNTGTKYPLFTVTGGKVYLENLICMEGSTPLFAQKQSGGSDIEVYAKNCKFFYSRTVDYDVCMLQGVSLAIFQNCEASFGMKDGFNYHAYQNVIPKAIEINCIGIGNGNIDDGNDQGSTIHDGGSIIRVRDVCAESYGANYGDQGIGTESWNIGCVGYNSLCDYSNIQISDTQNSNFFAISGANVFCDGCIGFGSLYNVCTSVGGIIYLRNSRFEGTLTKDGMTPVYY